MGFRCVRVVLAGGCPVAQLTGTNLRADTLAQIAADIHMHGLAAPMAVNMFVTGTVQLRMDDNDPVAVDLWAKHLGLVHPSDREVGERGRGGFTSHSARSYTDGADASDALPGWSCVEVWSAVYPVEGRAVLDKAGA